MVQNLGPVTLTRTDLPPDIVEFALFGLDECELTFGANRNALLLATLGRRFLSADDDTVCRLATPPESGRGLALSGDQPSEFWFFPDRETTLKSAHFVDRDLVAIHETLLGKDVRRIVVELAQSDSFTTDDAPPHFFQDLTRPGSCRVVATLNGILGDSGMHSGTSFLSQLKGGSRKRLLASEAAYRSAFSSREVLRIVPRNTVCRGFQLMTTAIGLDNRKLLPPFMPIGRNEDGTFGMTLWKCFRDGYLGYVPWALLHAPAETRTYPQNYLSYFANLRMADILAAAILAFTVSPAQRSGEASLGGLGQHLIDLGSASLLDFEEVIRVSRREWLSSYLSGFDRLSLTGDESPRYWAKDVTAHLESTRQALLSQDPLVPTDLNGRISDQRTRELSQYAVLKFGELLSWWPELLRATKDLYSKEEWLVRPV